MLPLWTLPKRRSRNRYFLRQFLLTLQRVTGVVENVTRFTRETEVMNETVSLSRVSRPIAISRERHFCGFRGYFGWVS